MSTPDTQVVYADNADAFVTAFLRVMPTVPKNTRRRLKHIMMTIAMRHGDQALFDRFNGRSVAQILEGSKDIPDAQPIASGEVNGLHYEVFEKQDESSEDSEAGAE